jgi:ribosomal protein L16 Arg81 hydroxylase
VKAKKARVSEKRIKYTSVRGDALAARGFSPSSAFWANFVKHHWDRKPLIIKHPFSVPMSTTEESFSALRNAADKFEKDGADVKWKFYKGDDGFMLEGYKIGGYVPRPSDQSLDDYAKRISPKLKGESFGLVLHDLQEYHPQFYLRMREFLSGLAAQVRVRWRAMPGLFVGNYDQTPFGIHQDPANVFAFIIEGRRRIYLWPEEYFCDSLDKARNSDFAKLRRDATILDGEPGDVLYWPGRYWHVGAPLGDLSIGVSVALVPVQLSSVVVGAIKNQIGEFLSPTLTADGGFPHAASDVEASPEMIVAAIKQAAKLLQRTHDDSDFIQALQVCWLDHITSEGSEPAPSPLPLENLDDDCVVGGMPETPIVWIVSDNQIVCSANGNSILLPAAPAIIALLTELNGGAMLRVRDLIKKYKGVSSRDGVQFKVTKDGLRFLLSKLYSLRAIRIKN